MTQTVTGPDGVPVDFPDGMSDADIANAFRQHFGNSSVFSPTPSSSGPPASTAVPVQAGAASTVSPSPPSNVGQTPSSTPDPQPSFTHRLLSNLAGVGQTTDDEMRALSNALTFGGADRFAAYMGGTNVADERAKTDAAKSRLFLRGAIPEAAGYYFGPGKVLGPVSKAVGGAVPLVGGTIASGAIEGGLAGGANAYGHGQDVPGGIVQGAAAGTVAPIASGVLSKTAGAVLPSWAGGKPPVPATADVDPNLGGGFNRNVSAALDRIQQNKKVSYSSPPSQVSGLLAEDSVTGARKLDELGYDPAQHPEHQAVYDALAKATDASPLSSAVMAHPFMAGGALTALTGGTIHALTGAGAGESALGGMFGEALHPFVYYGAKGINNAATNAAINDARRVIAGQPITGSAQNAINSEAARRALQSLIFGHPMGY